MTQIPALSSPHMTDLSKKNSLIFQGFSSDYLRAVTEAQLRALLIYNAEL